MNEPHKTEEKEAEDRTRLEKLTGGSSSPNPASSHANWNARQFGDETDRQLRERRSLMRRRIKRGRITLGLFAMLSLGEIVLQLFTDLWLPLSCTLSDLLTVCGFYFLPCMTLSLLPVIYMAVLAIWFEHEKIDFLRKCLPVFLWLDLILTLALGGLPYGLHNQYLTVEMAVNLVLHIPVIWFMQRAVRAVNALEVLPEHEIKDGDPYRELGY